jgi:putative transposase
MYLYLDHMRVINFYMKSGFNAAYTVRKVGYPDAISIKHWYKEYIKNDDLYSKKINYSSYDVIRFHFLLMLVLQNPITG